MARPVLNPTTMKRLLLLASASLPLIGCYGGERYNTGECPAGETCSDLTPKGLQFVGNHLVDDILLSGPRATAVGGTQTVALQYDRGDGVTVALDLPFTADDDGGLGVKVSAQSGSQVTMLGAGSRTNYLRILDTDGLLMDRKELTGAALDRVELTPTDFESIPNGTQLAFAPGHRTLRRRPALEWPTLGTHRRYGHGNLARRRDARRMGHARCRRRPDRPFVPVGHRG
jgi:hypothetical protein